MAKISFFISKIVLFLLAIWAVPALKPPWRREGTPFPILISAYYTVYVEALLFSCFKNTIFHMIKVVFQTLWTMIRLCLWGVPQIFPAGLKSMRNTFFEEQLVGCSSINTFFCLKKRSLYWEWLFVFALRFLCWPNPL